MDQAVSFRPWDSIKAGTTPALERRLSFAEALESPCATCSTSPCCTHLPIHTFSIASAVDVSYASYLLNFERIRLGVNRAGQWSAYYVYPCRFLDRTTFMCTVHATPEQPRICVSYSPYNCWYRKSLTQPVTNDFLLVDRTRFGWLRERLEFDDQRMLVAVPSFDDMIDAFATLSDDAPVGDPPIEDPAFEGWVSIALSKQKDRAAVQVSSRSRSFAEFAVTDLCDGCSAPCCDTLTFAQGLPSAASTLDYLRFCLGFPGVELAITDTGWWLVVKTRCQHLEDGRCSIYGSPDRPVQCTYYDAARCTYKPEFGVARPESILRVRLEQYETVATCIAVGDDGQVEGILPMTEIRDRVEASWSTGDRGDA